MGQYPIIDHFFKGSTLYLANPFDPGEKLEVFRIVASPKQNYGEA